MNSTPAPARRRTPATLVLAAANGFLAVGAGAFGAHAANDPAIRELLRTGAQYQLVHAVAAIAVLAMSRPASRLAHVAAWLFGVGALVFAGSLDVLAFSHVRAWGAITPIGGLALLAGWLCTGAAAWTAPRPPAT